ncbi:MAG TPA: anti-sigma factor [Rubrobacter sp.]|nr:anti-sigma factor [Rubrobacter sp.]
MDDKSFDDLKEAYALGALPDDERATVEAYLALHPERQGEIDDLSGVAGLLALAPPEQDPPEDLRRRLMQVVESESTSPEPARRSTSSWFGWLGDFRNVALGAAALLVVGLLSWNVLLLGDVQDLQGEVEQARTSDQAKQPREIKLGGAWAEQGAKAEVTALKDDRAILIVEDMPSVPEDRTGQVWVIRDDKPEPSGLLDPSGNMAATAITTPLKDADAIAVTVEPAGGSDEPTSDPVLVQEL